MTTSPERILVHVSGDRLGDALLKYPVLKAFRNAHPGTHITWVTSRNPSVFAGPLAFLAKGIIDELHTETGLGRSLLNAPPKFLAPRYSVVVATETRVLETLALRRIPHDAFISPGLRFALSTRRPDATYKHASIHEQFCQLMSLAAEETLRPVPHIEVPTEVTRVAELCFPDSKRYAGLSPGAGGPRKRWPLEKFIELAKWLARNDFIPTFFLGPEDAELRQQIHGSVDHAIFAENVLEARLPRSPINTIAAARRMTFSVTNDSGGGHLVAAGGRPVITLFGHTDPAKFRNPYCVQLALKASKHTGTCLAELDVEQVARVIRHDPIIRVSLTSTLADSH